MTRIPRHFLQFALVSMGKGGLLLIWLKRGKEVQLRAGRKIETKKDVGVMVFTLKIASDRQFLAPILVIWGI